MYYLNKPCTEEIHTSSINDNSIMFIITEEIAVYEQ